MSASIRVVPLAAMVAALLVSMLLIRPADSQAATGTWLKTFNGQCATDEAKYTNDFEQIKRHFNLSCNGKALPKTYTNCMVFATVNEAVFTAIGSSYRKHVVKGFGYAACWSTL